MARIESAAKANNAPDGWPEKAARFLYIVSTRGFSIAVLLAAWEILARSGTFTPFQLPALSAVLERIG
jgi:ABC-type nitrate/sulfonate/bicarbonate transport system permease component